MDTDAKSNQDTLHNCPKCSCPISFSEHCPVCLGMERVEIARMVFKSLRRVGGMVHLERSCPD
jgi:hypothetical protein